jgi:hydrogenase expression/formation protein HypC
MCLGVPGEVIEFDAESNELPTALVEFAGVRRRVCMACVPDARPGEFVIVHAGIAISCIDPDEAQRVFAYLNEIGDSDGWEGKAAREPGEASPGGQFNPGAPGFNGSTVQ